MHEDAAPAAIDHAGRADAIREAAADLAAVLPTRVEAAVARALETPDGVSIVRQVVEVQRAISALSRDLASERLGRVGDLEVLVDLIAAASAASRAEIGRLDSRVAALETSLQELAGAVDRLTPVVATVAEKLDRRVRISVHTEPGAVPFAAAEPTA